MDSIPLHSRDLIAALDERFPLRNPTPNMTHDDIVREAGRRDVVEILLHALKNPANAPAVRNTDGPIQYIIEDS